MSTTVTHTATVKRRNPLLALLGADGSAHPLIVNLTTWAAAVLMVISGYIHLHLYDIAYRHIATIGPLFIVQGIASMAFAVGAAIVRRVWFALVGAGTMIATVAGFLVSVNYGLFGFQDSFSGSNAIGAFVIEISSAVLFLGAAVFSLTGRPTATA